MTYVNLGNFIWEDLDGDGIQDVGEPGIAGVTVNLLKNGSIFQTSTTDSTGYYAFSRLSLGSYSIQVVLPSGYAFTVKDQGSDDSKDSDFDPITGKTATYTFPSPTTNNTIDAGLFRKGSITGYAYIDANNNGIKDAGETGISGVTLTLTGTNALGAIIPLTVTTASDGSYSFGDLRPGTYSVTEIQPTGYLDGLDAKNGAVISGSAKTDAVSSITLLSGTNITNNNFGELQPASISGSVYVDANNDGVKQLGETGVSGVTLTLSGSNDLGALTPITVTSASDGSYSFGNLRPGTYTVTEIQPSGYQDGLDAKNGLVISGSNTTDAISSITLASGVNTVNNTFGERLAYSPLTPTLGYVSQSTASFVANSSNGTPYNVTTNPIVIQPIENTSLTPQYFVLPEVGKQFIQTITLTNNGTTASDPNAAFTFTTANSPFVQFNYVWNDANNNHILDNGEVTYTNGQALGFSLNPGQSVTFDVLSTIIDPNNELVKENLTFQLQDNPNDPNDLGNVTANTTLYLTQTGFNKQSGSTAFSFDPFAPSTLTVAGNGGIAVNPNNPAGQYYQAATLPRDAGTLTEGMGGQNYGTPQGDHFFWLDDFSADADNTLLSSRGGTNSDPITLTNFLLVWRVAPGIDYTAFTNNGNLSGPNSAFNNTNSVANDSVIELFNNGYFSQAYADTTIQKNGQTLTGAYQGSRGNQTITQTAVAGSIQQSPLQQASFRNGFTGTFNQFVNQLATNKIWQVNITDNSGTASDPLIWSDYSWAANPDIAVIQRASGSQLYIAMGNGDGNLNLSQTGIFLSNGTRIGANIDGGNGKDRIRGTSGNDTLAGGNGKDTFVFGINSGIDTITDFKTSGGSNNSDSIDLTELGIYGSSYNSSIPSAISVLDALDKRNTSNPALGGNGNGVIDDGDRGVTYNGSTRSLSIDLSYFSDLRAGLNPSLNGPLNTNTTIILKGVSSLTSSFFV